MKKVIVSICLLFTIFIINNRVYAYKSYEIGDEVTYNGVDFYVIKDSSSDSDYVTLLKAEPLTVDEVNQYGAGHINNYTTLPTDSFYKTAYDFNGYGGISYYTSETCGLSNYTNCLYDYVNSDVKYVVDNWSDEKLDKTAVKLTRLISLEDLVDSLGFEYKQINISQSGYDKSEKTPTWVYNDNYMYWTMTPHLERSFEMIIIDRDRIGYGNIGGMGNYYVIRPVVELYKCSIDECVEETNEDTSNSIDIKDNNSVEEKSITNNESKEEVNVPNTLKSVSGLIILIGMVLVCVGLNIFIIIKNKDRKKD